MADRLKELRDRYRDFVFSRSNPPQDEVIALVLFVALSAQLVLRRAAATNEYSVFWPHVPFGGLLDLLLAFAFAAAVGLVTGAAGTLAYRWTKRTVRRVTTIHRRDVEDD